MVYFQWITCKEARCYELTNAARGGWTCVILRAERCKGFWQLLYQLCCVKIDSFPWSDR